MSKFDVAILVVGIVATIAAATVEWWIAFIIEFVIGHFFLFCNVVRLARPLELAWAAVFMALAAGTIIAGIPGWLATAGFSLAATAVVVAVEARKPSYHGVGWQWINPDLPTWWEAQLGEGIHAHSGERQA